MEEMFIASPGAGTDNPVIVSNQEHAERWTSDLNSVTQQVFATIANDSIGSKVIVRCDVLPVVAATDEDMFYVFSQVVNMIICCPLPDSKLFIYINSGYAPIDAHGNLNPLNQVEVTVCTNSIAGSLWEENNIVPLKQCMTICRIYGGQFLYNPGNKAGMLFTINLPGKLNIPTIG